MEGVTERGDQIAVPDLLTVAETAELLRCKPNLLYRRPDLIPGLVRIGTMIRFRRSELIDFLAQGGTSAPRA